MTQSQPGEEAKRTGCQWGLWALGPDSLGSNPVSALSPLASRSTSSLSFLTCEVVRYKYSNISKMMRIGPCEILRSVSYYDKVEGRLGSQAKLCILPLSSRVTWSKSTRSCRALGLVYLR